MDGDCLQPSSIVGSGFEGSGLGSGFGFGVGSRFVADFADRGEAMYALGNRG